MIRSALSRSILTATLAIMSLATATAPAQATTRILPVPVPTKPGIYNVSFEFAGTSARPPLIAASRRQLVNLPPDVTFLTGVRRIGTTRRWRGIATLIRFRTGEAPATGTTRSIRFSTNLPFRPRVRGFATGTSQATEPTAGGRWITRVGRLAQHPDVRARGFRPGQLLGLAGNILAGHGNPQLFHDATGTIPTSHYLVQILATGFGSGVVSDSTHLIECTVDTGQTSGRCSAWFAANTPNALTATPYDGNSFVDWTSDCEGAGAQPTCDLGAPRGGSWIIADAEFRQDQ